MGFPVSMSIYIVFRVTVDDKYKLSVTGACRCRFCVSGQMCVLKYSYLAMIQIQNTKVETKLLLLLFF